MKFNLSCTLILLATVTPAFADSSAQVEFSATITSDSHIEVKASIPKETATWVFFKVTQDSGTGRTDFIFPNDGTPLDKNLYLEFGAGAYTVEVLVHTLPALAGQYSYVARAHVT